MNAELLLLVMSEIAPFIFLPWSIGFALVLVITALVERITGAYRVPLTQRPGWIFQVLLGVACLLLVLTFSLLMAVINAILSVPPS